MITFFIVSRKNQIVVFISLLRFLCWFGVNEEKAHLARERNVTDSRLKIDKTAVGAVDARSPHRETQ